MNIDLSLFVETMDDFKKVVIPILEEQNNCTYTEDEITNLFLEFREKYHVARDDQES